MQTTLSFLLLFIIQNNLVHYGRSAPFEHVSGGFRRNFRPLSHQRVFCLRLFCLPFWLHVGIFWVMYYMLSSPIAMRTGWIMFGSVELPAWAWRQWNGLWAASAPAVMGNVQCRNPLGAWNWEHCVFTHDQPHRGFVLFGVKLYFMSAHLLFSVVIVICHNCRFIVIFSRRHNYSSNILSLLLRLSSLVLK